MRGLPRGEVSCHSVVAPGGRGGKVIPRLSELSQIRPSQNGET